MKKDVIEKLLNGQTTPEEEHLIAQRLQEEEDMERWLIEDETEVYDRIVGQRSAKRSYIRWAVAACFALLMAAGAVMLWPREQASKAGINNQEAQKAPQEEDCCQHHRQSAILHCPSGEGTGERQRKYLYDQG